MRPIQPSIRRPIAEWLASQDPRCDGNHATTVVARGLTCPKCGLHLRDYLAVATADWPEA